MLKDNNTVNLLEIQGGILTGSDSTETRKVIYLELEKKAHKCPCCGNKTSYIHDYRTQNVKDIQMFNKQTIFMYRKRRYICKKCNKKFYETTTL